MPLVGLTNQLFEVKDFQTISGQECLNVYWFIAPNPGITVSALNVAQRFWALVGDVVRGIQCTNADHYLIEVTEVTSLTNFATYVPPAGQGLNNPPVEPNTVAFGFNLLRSTRETRNGAKRYSAVPDVAVAGNAIDPTWEQNLLDVVAALDTTLDTAGEGSIPVIISKKYSPLPVRVLLPPSDWVYNPIGGVTYNPYFTTQKTRQPGIGR